MILIFLLMLVVLLIYLGIICFQVYLSKNNKKAKKIPTYIFTIVPVVIVIAIIVFYWTRDFEPVNVIIEGDSSRHYYFEHIMKLGICNLVLSWFVAISTLVVELICRKDKTRRALDEEIIDIQNL